MTTIYHATILDRCVSATVVTKLIRVTVFNHQIERLLNKKRVIGKQRGNTQSNMKCPKKHVKDVFLYICIFF